MKKTNMKIAGAMSALLLVLGLSLSHSSQVLSVAPPPPADVTICHATGAGTFNTIHTNENALNGHFENNGTPKDGHEDDVWFPGTVACPGPEPTGTPTPTPGEGTPTPTETPSNPGNPGGPGDGLSDGRSDGRSSCPECTQAPAGQVLGATTDYAATGTAVDMLVNAIGAMGGLSTAAGLTLIAKKRSNK